MSEHVRLANTPGNLQYLHDQSEARSDCAPQKNVQDPSTAAKTRHDSTRSKFAQKVNGLFEGKKAGTMLTTDAAEEEARKRVFAEQYIASQAVVKMTHVPRR
ncbi:hypothetical protein PHYBOEH_000407 [Phytophthora boehmeriae]|uniref:Uncharacterized protein n=1 Tax=Phytophthora boehmeriae TaxID=109152 RepID=A0A8T1WZJ9_9STRA|nr:hypothetical protein PHYBOEH_000407 [Phytophthora boehmeriae]